MIKFLISLSLFFSFKLIEAQSHEIDSLKLALKNLPSKIGDLKNDTLRCALLVDISHLANGDDFYFYNNQLLNLVNQNINKYADKKINDFFLKHYADGLNNHAYKIEQVGDISGALALNFKSLSIREKIGDKNGIPESLNNIAYIYDLHGDISKSEEFYTKSFQISKKDGNKQNMAGCLNNLGFLFKKSGDLKKALIYYKQALSIVEEIGFKKGISSCLNNIGVIYRENGDLERALDCFTTSLKIKEEAKDKKGISNVYNNMASVYLKMGKTDLALSYSNNSLKIAQELGFPDLIAAASNFLKNIYKKQGNNKQALQMFELYIRMRDSVNNEQTKKTSIKTQLKYEYEKKSAADSVKNSEAQKVKDAQLIAQRASLKQEKTQRYALYGGLVLVAGFLIFVINRFRITNKQKKIIEQQKTQVDVAFEKLHEKNKEVLDSIHYAKRIQKALITSEFLFDKLLKKLNSKKP